MILKVGDNMNEKDLKKLNRKQLLEIMIEQAKEIDRLNNELTICKQQLENKEIIVKEAGSIAHASLALNNVFDACQNACDQYLLSIQAMEKQKKELLETYKISLKDKVEKLLKETEAKCKEKEQQCELKCQQMIDKYRNKYEVNDDEF